MKLWAWISVLGFWAAAGAPAWAQSAITLHADPAPIVDAEINGQDVRLEIDLRFPRGVALNTTVAERLRVRRVPFTAMQVGIEGNDTLIRGRVARPRLLFSGRSTRAFTGILPVPVSERADGVMGPAVLPYDVITVVLGPEPEGARDIVFTLADPDKWEAIAQIGGQTLRVDFDLAHQPSVFNRTAARLFDQSGAITANGELQEVTLLLALTTRAQPVDTALTLEGLPIAPALARTNEPLLGATEEDAFVVIADVAREPPPPSVTIGRAALSRCSSIRVERETRRMVLHCAV